MDRNGKRAMKTKTEMRERPFVGGREKQNKEIAKEKRGTRVNNVYIIRIVHKHGC